MTGASVPNEPSNPSFAPPAEAIGLGVGHGEQSTWDARRLQILDAAGPIFAERGYQDATIREISSVAGVNLASINYYFGDKQTLYAEALRIAQKRNVAMGWLGADDIAEDPRQALKSFLDAMLARMLSRLQQSWEGRLLMREVLQPTHASGQVVEEYFRPVFDCLMNILRALLQADPRFLDDQSDPSDGSLDEPDLSHAAARSVGSPQARPLRACSGPPLSEDRLRLVAFSVVGQCLFYRVAGSVVEGLVGSFQKEHLYDLELLSQHIWRFTLSALKDLRDG